LLSALGWQALPGCWLHPQVARLRASIYRPTMASQRCEKPCLVGKRSSQAPRCWALGATSTSGYAASYAATSGTSGVAQA